jgi:hypothetical protein
MDNDPNSPRVLGNFGSEAEASLIIAQLESAGITARTSGMGGATGWPEAQGYTQVVVRASDLERALTLIRVKRNHPT